MHLTFPEVPMIDTLGSGKTNCPFDPDAECNRLWISKADGLHLGYLKKFREDPKLSGGHAPTPSGFSHVSDVATCEQCFRNHPN
jgi:hypothetical protein